MSLVRSMLAASTVALSFQAHAAAENWQFQSEVQYPIYQGQMTGLYRTQGIAPNGNEWIFTWQYGLERTDANFNSLQRTGSVSLPATINTGIPALSWMLFAVFWFKNPEARIFFILAVSAVLMSSIDTTIVAVAVPQLTTALDAPLPFSLSSSHFSELLIALTPSRARALLRSPNRPAPRSPGRASDTAFHSARGRTNSRICVWPTCKRGLSTFRRSRRSAYLRRKPCVARSLLAMCL